MRRLLDPSRGDQLVALVFSIWFLYTSVPLGAAWLDEHSDVAPVFFDWLWPWVFAAAGIVGLAYAAHPASRHLCAWSGGLMIAALLSRAFTVVATFLRTDALSWERAAIGAGVWIILGYAVGLIWRKLLMPLAGRRRRC